MPTSDRQSSRAKPNFATTRWSVVLSAGREDSSGSREALEKLCETYWFPLYAYVRRQGLEAGRAADVTQGFFASLLQRKDLATIDRKRGKFRTFLRAAIKNFMLNQIDMEKALKRGGDQTILSIDVSIADSRYVREPADSETPERLFDRQWALALLDQVGAELKREFEERGRPDQYEKLSTCLTGQPATQTYREVGESLGLSESAVKVIVHRMRQRFGELLRAEIAHTVASDEEVDEEIQALFEVLRK